MKHSWIWRGKGWMIKQTFNVSAGGGIKSREMRLVLKFSQYYLHL